MTANGHGDIIVETKMFLDYNSKCPCCHVGSALDGEERLGFVPSLLWACETL